LYLHKITMLEYIQRRWNPVSETQYKPPCPPPKPSKEICSEECGKIIIEEGPVSIFINCCPDGIRKD
jgi:hypothetical protein